MRDLTSGKPAAANGHFRIGSVTKTSVATVLTQLVDEGRLALDDPIEQHLPGGVPNGAHITVRQILQHTSGLHDYMSELGYSTNRWVTGRPSAGAQRIAHGARKHVTRGTRRGPLASVRR